MKKITPQSEKNTRQKISEVTTGAADRSITGIPSESQKTKVKLEDVMAERDMVNWFDELSSGDTAVVGGKNASLGEMIQNLSAGGILVPNGFAITAYAYRHLLAANNLGPRISEQIDALHKGADLAEVGNAVRQMFLNAVLPSDLARAIRRPIENWLSAYGGRIRMSRCAVVQRPRTSPRPASPGSRRPSSTSRARWRYWRPASAAMHPSSRTGRSATASNMASTTSKWLSPSVCSRWSARTWPEER